MRRAGRGNGTRMGEWTEVVEREGFWYSMGEAKYIKRQKQRKFNIIIKYYIVSLYAVCI